jgi:hypothetical protein
MSKEFKIDDDAYILLLKFYEGRIENLSSKINKGLKNGMFKDEQIKELPVLSLKVFDKIIAYKKKSPEKYKTIKWVFPDWDSEMKEQKLKDFFDESDEEGIILEEEGYTPDSPRPIEEEGYTPDSPRPIEEEYTPDSPRPMDDQEESPIQVVSDNKISHSILPYRKAYIDWVNDVFYKEQIDIHRSDYQKENDIKIYQLFVKNYLSFQTPYRGLLVYHGLGTGKTATAVSTAEGLSNDMKIYTLLPASLESEFVNEVKTWGDNLFKINYNHWVFISIEEIKKNLSLRKKLSDSFGINEILIQQLNTRVKNKFKKSFKDVQGELSPGIFLQYDFLDKPNEVFTVSGQTIPNSSYTGPCTKLTPIQKMLIQDEIDLFIRLKYNFIHYNPFPPVDEVKIDKGGNMIEENPDKTLTHNQRIVKELTNLYITNKKEHQVLSPFRNATIIIDEVHNFIRQIINGSAPAIKFYNWIVNSEDVKLIFLSGTPTINKPAEIAILYNMLRGVIHVYNFSINTDKNEEDIQKELKEIYYKDNSSIEQFHCSKQQGKLILSFTKHKTNFESIMKDNQIQTIRNNNHSLKDFFQEIYKGYEQSSLSDIPIQPSKSELLKHNQNDILLGKPIIFDTESDILFNRKQRLFDIYENEIVIDLSQNENFINYFLDESMMIPPKKQVLLRRMLMGLTSHYPIDRSSIVNMPQIVEPESINERYKDYRISDNINIVPCYMSSIQWTSYELEYTKQKQRDLQRLGKGGLYDNDNFDYHIRTRQNCNIVYEDDSFRKRGEDEIVKQKQYEVMKTNQHFSVDGTLSMFSPKFYEIMKRINNYIEDGKPTGKILYYSDFRQDSGSEAFEQILKVAGYEFYDHTKETIDTLVQSGSKKKRYTFITGEEEQIMRKINKDAFNHPENIYGEYIQIMIISSAGAEGISLKGVRQVHIMEPFWNFIRLDQVFGRAIRMKSHLDLPEDKRFVEQYLYLSYFPSGNTIEDVFSSMKQLKWAEVSEIDDSPDIKQTLLTKHKNVFKGIQRILSIKKSSQDRSVDQLLFDIMERKQKISEKISAIIKESSVDCIQNTRDDIQLNQKCIRFSKLIKDEDSHFPGINASEMNQIDTQQFESNFTFFIEPNIYVISAMSDQEIFIYYQMENISNKIDVRYIRENGKRICDYIPQQEKLHYYESKIHPLNSNLGSKFSVFQTIYNVPDYIVTNKIKENIYPHPDEIMNQENISELIIKYNVSEKLFYSPKSLSSITQIFDYELVKQNDYSLEGLQRFIVRNKDLFIVLN